MEYQSIFDDPLLEQDEHAAALICGGYNHRLLVKGAIRPVGGQLLIGHFEIDGVHVDNQHYTRLKLSMDWRYRLSMKNPPGWQALFNKSVLQWRARGQYSRDLLPSFEAQLLTGAFAIRGFQPGFFSAERGGLVSGEWYLPAMLNLESQAWDLGITPFLFADYGYGEKLRDGGKPIGRAHGWAAGIGVELSWRQRLYLQLVAAFDRDQYSDLGSNAEEVDVFFQVYYPWD